MGYLNTPFGNSELENGFTATSIENPHFAPRVFVGHFFNRYIAAQVSLMRPINWTRYKGVRYPGDKHSVWSSLFGITARPTIALYKNLALYGNLGLGFISRHGFNVVDHYGSYKAIDDSFITTFLSGAGLTYAFNLNWHLELGFDYTPPKHNKKQPSILYAYASVYYQLFSKHSEATHENQHHFPLNFIQLGFFTDEWFHTNVNQYFTAGSLPIFWDGKVKNRNGVYAMYERNFFHTDRGFSLEWGASFARYKTHLQGQTYYTLSLFPELKWWIIRGRYVDFYFTYSVAGPTYISKTRLDSIEIGEHFIFQDWMGIGVFLGRNKHFNVNLKIGHYSNGNLFPKNAGIEVPLTIAIGYAFD